VHVCTTHLFELNALTLTNVLTLTHTYLPDCFFKEVGTRTSSLLSD